MDTQEPRGTLEKKGTRSPWAPRGHRWAPKIQKISRSPWGPSSPRAPGGSSEQDTQEVVGTQEIPRSSWAPSS